MALMRVKLIEEVHFKKVPSAKLFSAKKVWGKQTGYQLSFKESPNGTRLEKPIRPFQCQLRLAMDATGDEVQYWYIMQKSDRLKAEEWLRFNLKRFQKQRWDVSDFAKETHTLFDEIKKFWVCASSKQTRRVTKEAEEKTQTKVLHDAVLLQSA